MVASSSSHPLPCTGVPVVASSSLPLPASTQGKNTQSRIFWSTISHTVIDKVVAGQIVEMSSLLPPLPVTSASQGQTFKLSADTSTYGYCVIVSQPARSARALSDWLEAWTNFLGIVLHAHPTRAAELCAYQHTILQAAREFAFPAVEKYDRIFRSRAALDPQLRWDEVQPDLYTTTLNARACRTFRPAKGARATSAEPRPSTITCHKFNSGRYDQRRCSYPHRCRNCNSPDHDATTCQSTK